VSTGRTGRTCREELQIPLNSAIGLDPANVPAASAPARGLGALLRESLVVLTRDPAFGAAVRAVAAPEHDLVFVGAETDLASHLMSDAAGVVVLDTAATVSPISQLSQGLKAQFPDLVLVVAGGAAEQSALSAQVTSGEVYRFLHKPASEQRMRLFIDAAWRRRRRRVRGRDGYAAAAHQTREAAATAAWLAGHGGSPGRSYRRDRRLADGPAHAGARCGTPVRRRTAAI
jgi:DNA-binding NtrC family response regulator